MTPAPLSAKSRLRPKDHVLVREVDGEAVLLDLDSGRYMGLNATGARIWALLAEGGDLAAIRDRLAQEYALPPETIEADLLEVCVEFERAGLVDPVA